MEAWAAAGAHEEMGGVDGDPDKGLTKNTGIRIAIKAQEH